MNIVVACGGSGGHTFPGLATAHELRQRGHQVTLWLAGQSIEQTVAQSWAGPIQTIPAQGFGGNPLRQAGAAWKMAGAIIRCYQTLGRERPDRLLAMGSYSSVGPVLAAYGRHIPVVLHESNAIPGRATCFLSRFAQAIALHFDSCRTHLNHPRMVATGMPLRPEFNRLVPRSQRPAGGPLTLLAMGGSQGAHRINEAVRDAVIRLHQQGFPLRIIHLSGRRDAPALEAAYREKGVPHEVHAFYANMPALYGQADLAISRAGAASCAELLAGGLPTLLIPYPEATRDHQTANARYMAAAGAAEWIPQSDASAERIAEFIARMERQPDDRENLRQGALRLAIPQGALRLAELVESGGS
jgi:UDP-N-acetylglucosamine--N-acetylmuramyl-(pentapeptide) pyrophosphoryl-undecaprenol N-acetylglucosamine transferase